MSKRALITVNTLVRQARDQGAIALPADALITPAAADWLRSTRLPVSRGAVEPKAPPSGPTRYVVGDAASPILQALLPQLERQYPPIEMLPCHNRRSGLLAGLRQACAGLASCADRRLIVIVENGAIAHCVLNKCPEVRAAICCRVGDVLALKHDLDINALILETTRLAHGQMLALIDRFLTGGAGRLDPLVRDAIAGLTPGDYSDCQPCSLGGR